MDKQTRGPRYPITCKVLEQIGLDPSSIPEYGMDETGYLEIQFDGDAVKRLVFDGEIVKIHREWGAPHAWTFVREAMEQDIENWGNDG